MIYNEEFETLPREALEALQLKRLRQVVQRVYHTVGFYRKAFDKAGVKPEDIKTRERLEKIPFTTKQDLRDSYPFGLFAVPMSSIVRLHASSGTTGRSTVVVYTKRDIETWSELVARCFVAAGLTKNDIIHNAYGIWALHRRPRRSLWGGTSGCKRYSHIGGNTKRQIMILQDFGPTAICCTPSLP
jgi:phenylacetate-CoA ligase